MEKAGSLDRFLALVKREFAATDARLLAPDDVAPAAENVVICELEDGRKLVVAFAESRLDRDVIERRIRILADTFAESLGSAQFRAKRAAAPTSLAEELRALGARCNAVDVVVIDVDSPVVWGSALGPAVSRSEPPPALVSRPQLLSGEWDDDQSSPGTTQEAAEAAAHDAANTANASNTVAEGVNTPLGGTAAFGDDDAAHEGHGTPSSKAESAPVVLDTTSPHALRAIAHLREVPDVASQAHRGKYVRLSHVDSDFAYLAASFSSIYMLVLVYGGSFDEILAERAAQDAMPRIERLVLALPPLDPEPQPMGQAMSLRARRRR